MFEKFGYRFGLPTWLLDRGCDVTWLVTFENIIFAIRLLPSIRLSHYACARMHMQTYKHAPNLIKDGPFTGHTSIAHNIANNPSHTT